MSSVNEEEHGKLINIILIGVIAIGITAFWGISRRSWSTAEDLFNEPKPLPAYINTVSPYPGTTYPFDAKSIPARNGFETVDRNVCARFNSLSVDNSIETFGQAYSRISLDRFDLYLDGKLVDDSYPYKAGYYNENKYPIKSAYGSALAEALFERGVFIPIDICWDLDLPNGLYLAKLEIQLSLINRGEYEWAFRLESP